MSPKSKKSYVPKRLGRRADQMRPVKLELDYIPTADGSCLISFGRTRVICTASITPGVPPWMAGSGRGWVTAEYGMLPASTSQRKSRPIGGKPDGRGTEIQRLIGRVLRGAVRTDRLGENTIYLDCDVITADGGTRTAAITGAFVALSLAVNKLIAEKKISASPILSGVAAVSVGIVKGEALLDLCYTEDVAAAVDMNLVMNARGEFIELQGTGEEATFTDAQLVDLLALGKTGIKELLAAQQLAISQG